MEEAEEEVLLQMIREGAEGAEGAQAQRQKKSLASVEVEVERRGPCLECAELSADLKEAGGMEVGDH